MAKEIERKFLVGPVPFDLTKLNPKRILQGYFTPEDNKNVNIAMHRHGANILSISYAAGKTFSLVIPRMDALTLLENYGTDMAAGMDWQRGNLASGPTAPTVRIRLQDSQAFLTIKGKPFRGGLVRDEFEYEIPVADAQRLLDIYCQALRVEKSRYCIPHGDLVIELDVFHGHLEGLVLAEVEFPSEDTAFDAPDWFLEDVSADKGYTNVSLARRALQDKGEQ